MLRVLSCPVLRSVACPVKGQPKLCHLLLVAWLEVFVRNADKYISARRGVKVRPLNVNCRESKRSRSILIPGTQGCQKIKGLQWGSRREEIQSVVGFDLTADQPRSLIGALLISLVGVNPTRRNYLLSLGFRLVHLRIDPHTPEVIDFQLPCRYHHGLI